MTPIVLFVDDDIDFLRSSVRLASLQLSGCTLKEATTEEKALAIVEKDRPHVVVLDLSLSPQRGVESGFSVLNKICRLDRTCGVIVLTGHGSDQNGFRAVESGASHFLQKGNHEHLLVLIKESLRRAKLLREFQAEAQAAVEPLLEKSLVGVSSQIQKVREDIQFAARTPQPVLITGETGTGKSTVARAIHMSGPRREYSFEVETPPDVADLSLVMSELLGHRKGAFTGATSDRVGAFERADGGTLFLDDIDTLPLKVQQALLSVLESKEFTPLGASKKKQSDFRLITATNHPLDEAISSGLLRSDLFFRISGLHIEIPPLRERPEDIPVIAQALLRQVAHGANLGHIELTDEVADLLKTQFWKGNVRELETAVTTAAWMAVHRGRNEVEAGDFRLSGESRGGARGDVGLEEEIYQFRKSKITDALFSADGNRTEAAKILRLSRTQLYDWLKKYDSE